MNLYAFDTENRFGEYLIFTSKEAALTWARAATTYSDSEIRAHLRKLTQTGCHYNLFTETFDRMPTV